MGVILSLVLMAGSVQAATLDDIVFTEIMATPNAVADADGEWIEVQNNSLSPVDIGGWILNDGSDHTISGPYSIPAGEKAVICRDNDSSVNGGVKCHYQSVMVLTDIGKTLQLLEGVTTINEATYGDTAGNSGKSVYIPSGSFESVSQFGNGDYGTPAGNGASIGTHSYASIQIAIDAAISGNTIDVGAGTYAENVSLDGKTNLTIQGAGEATIIEPASGIGFAIKNSSGITIKNLKIHTTGTNAHGVWVAGTPNGGATAVTGLTVQDDTIVVDGYSSGIYAEQVDTTPHSGWLITGNTITVNPGAGVTGDGMDLHDVSGSEVSYNTIILNTPTDSTNVLWTSELSNLSSLIFSNNTISGSSGSEIAILTDFLDALADTSITTVTVSGNTFSNWGSRALRVGTANGTGAVTEIAVNSNIFQMAADTTEVIGGTAASSATGSGNIFNVSGTAKIQKAVDGAFSGDTINVAAGTYDEQVVIDGEDLILQGVGDTTIIRPSAPATLTQTYTFPAGTFWSGTTASSIILVENASAVTIKDLKVDGINVTSLPLTGSPDRLVGVLLGVSSGTIDNATVTSIKTAGYANRTYGIEVSGADSGTYSVEVKSSHITDWARNGIVADGTNLTANINHNTLVGPGTISGQVANGILFIGGAAGNTTSNTISGMHYNADPVSRSAGILIYGATTAGILIDQNDISDTDDGINLSASSHNATVSNNNLHNNLEVGIQLENGTANNAITGNTIVNNTMAGIRFGGAGDPVPAEADTPPGAGNVANDKNTITGNANGIVNYDTGLGQIFDAANNWWGNVSGPFNTTSNPLGTGDSISDNVNFVPWYSTSGMTTLVSANMIAYNTALDAVSQTDYTTASWSAYQAIVTANTRTDQNTQTEVDDATAAITTAQLDLIAIADLTDYNTALDAVVESDYTTESWATYQAIVDANVVTDQHTQAEVDTAIDNITIAQDDLVATLDVAKTTAHEALTTARALYTDTNYTAENLVVLNGFKSDGDIAIDSASDLAGVSTAQNTATAGMAGVLKNTQTAPDDDGNATMDSDTTEVVITDPDQPVDITIESGTENPTIDVSAFITDGIGILPEITINSDVADVIIPDSTTVTGPTDWDGVISVPTATTTTGTAPAGFSVGGTVISVGSSQGTLTFSNPVTILLAGVTGTVGYKPAGSDTWQTITNVCADPYATPGNPPAGSECAISNGTDTKIVTFHFTEFGELDSIPATPIPPRSSRAGDFSPAARRAILAATPNASAVSVVGQVLGAFTEDERQAQIVSVRGQLIEKINQLIGLLRVQLAAAITAGDQ